LLSKDFPRPALKSSIPSATSDTNSLSKSRGRVSVFDVSILEASIRLILGLRSYLSFAICIFRSYSSTQGKPAALLATVCFSPPGLPARQRDPAPLGSGRPASPRRSGQIDPLLLLDDVFCQYLRGFLIHMIVMIYIYERNSIVFEYIYPAFRINAPIHSIFRNPAPIVE